MGASARTTSRVKATKNVAKRETSGANHPIIVA